MEKKFWCCIITTAVVITTLIIVFLSIFIHWPDVAKDLEFAVTDASLKEFSFTYNSPNNTLSYNLTLSITIRNPNKKGGLYFDRIQIIANYKATTFSVATLTSTPFYLGAKNATVLDSIVLQGTQSVLLEEKELEKYRLETSYGVFSMDVKLALLLRDVRFRKGKVVGRLEPPKVECNNLKVPLHNNNGSSFRATWCLNVYIFTSKPEPYHEYGNLG